ncbi:MAG: nucleoside triphosphate pyrophosphohydrolase [Candidatus Firestonebacteria bacterium]|nr:nucleoside triphosphate pyrophosphohydrolase [Candidatus Firestonebacteria bacterium]
MNKKNNTNLSFIKLVNLMQSLRGDKGCPWDKEQTHKSIRNCLIEEAYEVLEAIDEGNPHKLKEELGDLLLQVVFHSQIADENNQFTIEDVISAISDKLIRRHPHVFSDLSLKNKEEVLNNWEKIKQEEKKNINCPSILDGIPKNIPSLIRAHRIQDRVARVGFDWKHINDVYKKLDEEMQEFKDACNKEDQQAILEELGDVFFTLVNVARFLEKDPEEALQKTISKFIERFKYIEKEINKENKNFDNYNLIELEKLWEDSKKGS